LERVIATEGVTPASRAKALQLAGRLGTYTGRLDDAIASLEESAEIWAGLGETTERGRTLAVLGDALLKSDDARAEVVLLEALQLFTDGDDAIGRRNAFHLLGEAAWRHRDLARARDFLEQSLELARRIGDSTYTGATLHHLGDVALADGDPARAEAIYGEGLALVWQAEARRLAAYCIAGLAATAAGTGRAERAARLWHAVEKAEGDLGLQLPQAERSMYAAGVMGVPPDDLDALSLEEAVVEALTGLKDRELAATGNGA
jgi:tetratricopeptide (TPR) repeat protein